MEHSGKISICTNSFGLVPATTVDKKSVRAALNRLKAFAYQNKLKGLDWKALRDEGRR